ncbi:F-box only protein 2 [Oryzias melastigma]|uniref:F-box protein 2 n=1 Tax=Oryzias melastigma TaxID=30732 RepID=A0A3B3B3R9_ORYME|nr:F-box only protein 2 [Oryzias melastigma]
MPRNLLKNPCGEDGLKFWEVTNGGNGWRVEDMPGDAGHDFCNKEVKKYFATSFEWCSKEQLIDLSAEDYSSEQLDAQPEVTVEDWCCSRTDCGCEYQLTVTLLDKYLKVIEDFRQDQVFLYPDEDDCSWKQIKHTFSGYGPGLRFIFFEHRGKDNMYWKGWYGVRVTGSSVPINL